MKIILLMLFFASSLYSQSFTITRQNKKDSNLFFVESKPKFNLSIQDSVFPKIYTIVDKTEASALLVEYKLPNYSISFGPNLLLWFQREKFILEKSNIGFEVKFTIRFK